MLRKTAIVTALCLLPAAAFAQSGHHGHHGRKGGEPTFTTMPVEPASTTAYKTANDVMHKHMDIEFSGDADIDFVRGMIPHHQGAVDMAKVVLEHGRDERTRKWAADIIREQEREIAEMRAWLKGRGAE